MARVFRIDSSKGTGGWIQQPVGHSALTLPDNERAALWVPDPVRPSEPQELQIHIEKGWEWSTDAGRVPPHDRCECIMWPSSGFAWSPTPDVTTHWEVHGMRFAPATLFPQKSSGNTYGPSMSQTNSNSANSHYFGEKFMATTAGSQFGPPGLAYGSWLGLSEAEWTANRGKWIHAVNQIFYGSGSNGFYQTTLYVNGVLLRTGPRVTGAQINPSDMPHNRKIGSYRIRPTDTTRGQDPMIAVHEYAVYTTQADAVASVTSTFGGAPPTPTLAAFNRAPSAPLAGQEVTLDSSASVAGSTITDRTWVVQ